MWDSLPILLHPCIPSCLHCCNALPNAAEFIFAGAAEDFILLVFVIFSIIMLSKEHSLIRKGGWFSLSLM